MRIVLLFLVSVFTLSYASGQNYEPKWVGQVVVLNIKNDTIVKPAEKASVKVKTKQSAGRLLAGIGNVRQKVYIQGSASALQLDPNEPITLIVKCKDNESDPYSFIQVVKFEKGRNERRTELAMENWLGNTSEGNMLLVPYEVDSYGKSSYILTIQPQRGEFGVRVANPNSQDERVPIFYCFGTSSYGNPVPVKMEATKTDAKDGTNYEYKGNLYPVYVSKYGERYILISKKERMYLPANE